MRRKPLTVVDIITALGVLRKEDLMIIRGALDRLTDTPEVTRADQTSPLFDALISLLSIRMSYAAFAKPTRTYKQWQRHAPGVIRFIESTFKPADRITTHALMAIMLEMLQADLKGRHVPISLGSMIVNMQRIPKVFDAQFPDYIESGLVNVILKRMKVKA